jgi:hypothetical protein
MTATDFLTAAGYERLGSHATPADVTLWLCSGGPDILVEMTREDLTAADANRAIYRAGLRDKRDEIAGRWQAFTDAMRVPAVSELWTNARELQAVRQAEMIEAVSMPKT